MRKVEKRFLDVHVYRLRGSAVFILWAAVLGICRTSGDGEGFFLPRPWHRAGPEDGEDGVSKTSPSCVPSTVPSCLTERYVT